MRHRKKVTIILLLLWLGAQGLSAQYYETAVGLRAGTFTGITAKHFFQGNQAIEGIVSFRWEGFNITGLYEVHNDAFDVSGLEWYYGFGAHLGFWNGRNVRWADDEGSYTVIGVDGIIGIEYNFAAVPINLSLDWKPAINLVGYTGFWGDGGALSIRYIF